MRNWLGIVGLAAALVIGMEPVGMAQSAKKIPGQESASRVRLSAFSVPVMTRRGKKTSAFLAAVLDISDPAAIGDICRMSPRIKDALMVSLYKQPIKVVGPSKFDAAGAKKQLIRAANSALGGDVVTGVEFVPELLRQIGGPPDLDLIFCSKRK